MHDSEYEVLHGLTFHVCYKRLALQTQALLLHLSEKQSPHLETFPNSSCSFGCKTLKTDFPPTIGAVYVVSLGQHLMSLMQFMSHRF